MAVDLAFKRAEQGDYAEVSAILAQSWRWAYRGILEQGFLDSIKDDRWVEFLQKTEGLTVIMLTVDGQPAGASVYRRSANSDFTADGEVVCLYLLPEHAGKGLGRALLLHVEELLAAVYGEKGDESRTTVVSGSLVIRKSVKNCD